jgi:hypothetical protein
MEQLGLHLMDRHEIWYLNNFWKSDEKTLVSLKSDENDGYMYINVYWLHLTQFFVEWEVFQAKVTEKIKRQFMFNNFF